MLGTCDFCKGACSSTYTVIPDSCLGFIENVIFACCGHNNIYESGYPYIVVADSQHFIKAKNEFFDKMQAIGLLDKYPYSLFEEERFNPVTEMYVTSVHLAPSKRYATALAKAFNHIIFSTADMKDLSSLD